MLQDLLVQVQALDDAFRRKGSITWYRGHGKSEWALTATIHRYIERLTLGLETPPEGQERRDLLRKEYKGLYRQFKADAWPLLGSAERSDWGVIFTMQHYGLPTRLLDWTESFACALFFAHYRRQRGDAAAVWVLDSEGLNEVSLRRRGLVALDETVGASTVDTRRWHPRWPPPSDDLPTIAVSPICSNPRMTAQRAAFTLAGDSFLPLDQQFDGRLAHEGLLVKIELPPDCSDEVDDYLRLSGVRCFTYFPDLEGLALDHEALTQAKLRDTTRFFPGQVKKGHGTG